MPKFTPRGAAIALVNQHNFTKMQLMMILLIAARV
jgi:hypothetical protein